jgi:AraC family transcriptional regulator, transcriptional activator of pobA
MKRGGRTLALDRLPDPADAAKVLWLRGLDVGGEAGRVREPHRHDYHELVWIHSGRGEHLLDGQPVPVRPGTVTLIGRGQVHVFVCARAVEGAVVRFGDELLFGSAQRAAPGWRLPGRGGRTVPVPVGEADRLESVIAALDSEVRRPADPESAELQRCLIAVVLLWIERWHDAADVAARNGSLTTPPSSPRRHDIARTTTSSPSRAPSASTRSSAATRPRRCRPRRSGGVDSTRDGGPPPPT